MYIDPRSDRWGCKKTCGFAAMVLDETLECTALSTSTASSKTKTSTTTTTTTFTIYDLISQTSGKGALGKKMKSIKSLIDAADLESTLREATVNGYTAFLPEDSAFTEKLFPQKLTDKLLKPTNKDFLKNVILRHILPTKVTRDALEAGHVTALNGDQLTVIIDEPVRIGPSDGNLRAQVVQTDVFGSNGVIHTINSLLWLTMELNPDMQDDDEEETTPVPTTKDATTQTTWTRYTETSTRTSTTTTIRQTVTNPYRRSRTTTTPATNTTESQKSDEFDQDGGLKSQGRDAKATAKKGLGGAVAAVVVVLLLVIGGAAFFLVRKKKSMTPRTKRLESMAQYDMGTHEFQNPLSDNKSGKALLVVPDNEFEI
jgi:uncharacterized surface protein with fasciclin (FAS1) repeats